VYQPINHDIVVERHKSNRIYAKIGELRIIIEAPSDIEVKEADRVIDASGKYVFPGAVDSHFHIGIFRPLDENSLNYLVSAYNLNPVPWFSAHFHEVEG
jgi:imidazolonepropionase-like amidohydrolase